MKFIAIILLTIHANYAVAQLPDETTIYHLQQFRSIYNRSMNDNKFEAFLAYYDNNIRLMSEFQKTMMSKENALLYYKAFSNRFDIVEFNRSETELIDLGTKVIEIGSFTEKLILKKKNDPQKVTGKYMDIWSKENGELKLITQAWNYNHSLPWEDQLKFDEVPTMQVALEAHMPINNPVSFELAALNLLVEKTVMEHDDQVWLQLYSDGGSFMYSRNPPILGKDALKEFLKRHVLELPIFEKLDVRNDRINDLGKYVIEYASHIAIIRNGDFSGVFTGKDLVIWRREPNGSLKIFRHIAMYD